MDDSDLLNDFQMPFALHPGLGRISRESPASLVQKRIVAWVLRQTALAAALILAFCAMAWAQSPLVSSSQPPSGDTFAPLPDAPLPQAGVAAQANDKGTVTLVETPVRILKDQAAIWTSPIHMRTPDLRWAVPLALATTVAITADHQAMSSVVSHDPLFNHANVVASDVLTGGFIAAPVALMGMGQLNGNPVFREAGILSGEALVDGVIVEQGMKLIFWRERPSADGARGRFFQTSVGVDSSFPSSHSVLTWSSAAVIAEEYPSFWTQLGVYSLATGVSLTRVMGQEHFPSDVLVGSAAGWLIGHYVYRKHHKF